jgi:hypothetical protein
MKYKIICILSLLFLVSLLALSNKSRSMCDGNTTYVAPEDEAGTEDSAASSPLLRIVTTL